MTCGRKVEVSKQLGIDLFFEDNPVDIQDLIRNNIPTVIKDAPYNRSFPYPLQRIRCWREAGQCISTLSREAHRLQEVLDQYHGVVLNEDLLLSRSDLLKMQSSCQEDGREREARERGLSYVALLGDIGCMVNGAGLAMATLDILHQLGGRPANFLDIGGNATTERIADAFKILALDPQVRVIFINIFGGMVRCDRLAEGLIQATSKMVHPCPLVVRLEGTYAREGLKILQATQLPITIATSIDRGAELAVQAARE